MFTMKFVGHHDNGSTVYGCERYHVAREEEHDGGRLALRMYRHLEDDNPYFEYVGDKEPHHTCYVMNDAGSTVDVIR